MPAEPPITLPKVDSLTLTELAGQVLCLGFSKAGRESAATVNSHARAILQELQCGAVALFTRNLGAPPEIAHLTRSIASLCAIPPLFGIDQEGGLVNRIPHPVHAFPGAMALGAITRSRLVTARRQARVQARELRAMGIQWNFAPVADVNSNPANPVIGVRSFGQDPNRVAELVAELVHGYQKYGLLACAKHFPGHGDTSVDSHLALPTIGGSLGEIELRELVPFQAAIRAGTASIMTSHILFPGLDPVLPATLSPTIISKLLRKRMGFDGLVITDCLEMRAIADQFGTANAAVQALRAGADMALVCHTLAVQTAARDSIVQAVATGQLAIERLREAAGRVLAAKQKAFEFSTCTLPAAPWNLKYSSNTERLVAERALTLVRKSAAFSLMIPKSNSIAVIGAHDAVDQLGTYLSDAGFTGVLRCRLPSRITGTDYARAVKLAESCDTVVLLTISVEPWVTSPVDQSDQAGLARALVTTCGKRLVAVSLRNPYDAEAYPLVENYICLYSASSASLRALVELLNGRYTPTGRLPVTVRLPQPPTSAKC